MPGKILHNRKQPFSHNLLGGLRGHVGDHAEASHPHSYAAAAKLAGGQLAHSLTCGHTLHGINSSLDFLPHM